MKQEFITMLYEAESHLTHERTRLRKSHKDAWKSEEYEALTKKLHTIQTLIDAFTLSV